MGFVEIEKNVGLTRLAVDATYRVNNKGRATLRFTKNGIHKLTNLKALDLTKPFKLYVDKDAKSLAFKQAEEGKFKLSGLAPGRNSLSYSAISKQITETLFYMIEESTEYSFLLVPAKDTAEVKVEAPQPTPEVTPEEPKAAKKPRTKKK